METSPLPTTLRLWRLQHDPSQQRPASPRAPSTAFPLSLPLSLLLPLSLPRRRPSRQTCWT